ncbi:MAG: very short patch repair endonuclease [Firmicutes bacterium]|nr:very short patch repair endonuclease [Bacillota bacterium]
MSKRFDFDTTEQHSKLMRRVKSKNTMPERILMRALTELGIYYSKHQKSVVGTPDIVFKRKKIAVFIDSEFWHGKAHIPKKNYDYWFPKFEKNRARDIRVNSLLAEAGWVVIRFTEKEVKKDLLYCIEKILSTVFSSLNVEK